MGVRRNRLDCRRTPMASVGTFEFLKAHMDALRNRMLIPKVPDFMPRDIPTHSNVCIVFLLGAYPARSFQAAVLLSPQMGRHGLLCLKMPNAILHA
eukprot:2988545-Pyramimonas_sp.AAC.1